MTSGASAYRVGVAPIPSVLIVFLAIWTLAAIALNWQTTSDRLAREDPAYGTATLVAATLSSDRPILPAPHQIVAEMANTIFGVRPSSPRSLLFHAGVTLSSTLLLSLIHI